jgi:hypothetical protein
MTSKPLWCIALSLLSALVISASEQKPFSLSIETQPQTAKLGEDIHLRIALTNTSSSEIRFAEVPGDPPPGEFVYKIEVRDSKGQSVRLTEYGRKFNGVLPVRGSRVTHVLQPGQSVIDDVTLNKLYDLAKPDKYTVEVTRQIPEHLGKGTIRANSTTLTIIQ